jgi:chromate reductase, NAD(P)H dehydrogenase (quinone)
VLKKKVLAISGSARGMGRNTQLLIELARIMENEWEVDVFNQLCEFPLFQPQLHHHQLPEVLSSFLTQMKSAELVLIATPEYSHNIPAVLKNMLEWCTESGELFEKKVIAFTFSPHYPRGEYAMKSLGFTLQALQATVIAELSFYQDKCEFIDEGLILPDDYLDVMKEVVQIAFM